MRKCQSGAKVRIKCENYIKINGRDTRVAVCSSAYLRVTLACVVVRPNIQQEAYYLNTSYLL